MLLCPRLTCSDHRERISPDSVVWCTGTVPNTSFLKNGFSSILDPAGRVKVLRTMQVVGYKHIFAGGDVCMRFAFEEKCVETALSHANVIVRNILRLSEGQKLSDHREVRGMNDQIIDFGPGPGLCIKVNIHAHFEVHPFAVDVLIVCRARQWSRVTQLLGRTPSMKRLWMFGWQKQEGKRIHCSAYQPSQSSWNQQVTPHKSTAPNANTHCLHSTPF